jgi:hypothetical protein
MFVVVVLVGIGVWMYAQETRKNSGYSPATQSEILLGEKAFYENLSSEEKKLVGAYYDTLGNDTIGLLTQPISSCVLKYYDPFRALIGCGTPKGTTFLLVDRENWRKIGEGANLRLDDGYIESDTYAISTNLNEIFYYEVGKSSIKSVPNSKLSSVETYQESAGLGGGNFTVSFDASTKTISAEIYKATRGGERREKIRTATFVLP